jgi:hypothetical protein
MKRRHLLALPMTLPLLSACASVDTEQTTILRGVIETVDVPTREVLVRGAAGAQSGALLTMVAGRAVQRLDQFRPGDNVTVVYFQAIAARVARPLSTARPASMTLTAERDAARPGGEVTRVRSGRVTITAVNAATNTVSFTGPGGLNRTVTATNPELQRFFGQLRVGEQVDMTYEEALAIEITPMR